MSAFDGQHPTICQGSSGALTDRRIEAPSAEEAPRSGPRRAPGTLERSVKVYGATLPAFPFLKCGAEAPVMGAGAHDRRGNGHQKRNPRGSAAGGFTGAMRRWSL
jgi:hypothetical protein